MDLTNVKLRRWTFPKISWVALLAFNFFTACSFELVEKPVTQINPAAVQGSGITIPAGLRYPTNPASYLIGFPITSNVPVSTGGTISSYSVSPALPPGLKMDLSSGILSGMPTTATSVTNYTVVGSNSRGSASATLVINTFANTKVPAPTNFYYGTNLSAPQGTAVIPVSPTITNGAGATFTTDSPLPDGIVIDSGTGTISGTPALDVPPAFYDYMVTATNAGGSATTVVDIRVDYSAATRPITSSMVATSTGHLLAYSAIGSENAVLNYSINSNTGALSEVARSTVTVTQSVCQLFSLPNGIFSYLSQFTGPLLTIKASGSTISSALNSNAIGDLPFGIGSVGSKYLYVANLSAFQIAGYSVDATSGLLTEIAGSPFTENEAENLAITPDGRFLYVTHYNVTPVDIAGFAIAPTTGALTKIPGSPFVSSLPSGTESSDLVIDPTGSFLYVAAEVGGKIIPFGIDPNSGALSEVTANIVNSQVFQPISLAISPRGQFLYAISSIDPSPIAAFAMGPGGSLSPITGVPPEVHGDRLHIEPQGKFLFVSGSRMVTELGINSANGTLTSISSMGAPVLDCTFYSSVGTYCTGDILASGTFPTASSSYSYPAGNACASAGKPGTCCMYQQTGTPKWYITNGIDTSGQRQCDTASDGTPIYCNHASQCGAY